METVTTQPEPATFESVWAMMQDNARQMAEYKERQEEQWKKHEKDYEELRKSREEDWKKHEKYWEELRKSREEDWEKRKKDWEMREKDWEEKRKKDYEELRESQRETDRIVKRNGKQIGNVHRKFGKLAEHLVAPGIVKRFIELGYHFGSFTRGSHMIIDQNGRTITEVDILLENDDFVVAVEVKVEPKLKDIEHHLKRLAILREYRKKNDFRKIRGAIAGAIFGSAEKQATLEAGLYVIEQSGDTMKIDVPEDFIPREY
jgi:hypothetical protein